MDEQTKAAFDSAADTSKQLITLATGLIGLEITFVKDILGAAFTFDAWARVLLGGSWIFLLLSIIAGVWTLLALTGSICRTPDITAMTVYKSNVRFPAAVQILLFVGGLWLSVWFGIRDMK